LAHVKGYHDAMARVTLEEMHLLLCRILSLFVLPTGRELRDKIVEEIRKVLGSDIPFDSDMILKDVSEGEYVEAHVDFGLCPWHTCSGKTDSGSSGGSDTSMLGKFYRRLDRSIQTGTHRFP
jgi:hypothetical protein